MTETLIEESLRLAREAKAARTPEQVAAAERAEAMILSRFVRMFDGPEELGHSKGKQPCVVLSVVEFREFRKTHPVTHRWGVEWEERVLAATPE